MAEYGILGYLAKAHTEQLVREAAIARGMPSSGKIPTRPSILKSLLMLVIPH